jgi:hypothetical protein
VKSNIRAIERASDPVQGVDAVGVEPPLETLDDLRNRLEARLPVNTDSTVPGAVHRRVIHVVNASDFDRATKWRIAPKHIKDTRKNHAYDGTEDQENE